MYEKLEVKKQRQ